ncbi:MAG: hypothetical protein E6Q76_16895, partial [Rhizobium sp.]
LGAIGTGVKLAADAEQMQVAFETMLGSAEQAKAMLSDLRQYAMKSPFSQVATVESAQLLLNYGVAADQIMPTMRMLGDIAAGDQNKMRGLSVAFGQMSATGRLMGQDLNQMINAGFNPLQEISKRTGESMGALKARMEAGGVSVEEVRQAMVDATSAGGRFFGMTDRQSATLTGRFSSMKDEVADTLRTIGQMLIDTFDFRGHVEAAGTTLAEFRSWITQSGRDVIIFGGALLGFVGALAAVRTAIQAATIATAIWKSISSPAGFAMVAAGILGATFAVASLEEMFNASSQRAMELSKNSAQAAASVRDLASAGKAPQQSGDGNALAKAMGSLRRIREEIQTASGNNLLRLQGEEASVLGRINEMTTFKDSVDKGMERVNALHSLLGEVKKSADQLGESKVSELTYEIERQIGLVSGYTDKMQKLRQEISGMSQIDIQAQELSQAGATHQQVEEFRTAAEEADRLKKLRAARESLIKEVQTPSESFKKQLDELHAMRQAGLIDQETFNRGRDLAAANMAKEEAAKDKKERQSSRPLEAMLRDSKASQEAIARGIMAGKDSPYKKLESIAERTAKATELGNTYLADLAERDPEVRQEVDF